jgi:hypothetical protein
VSDQHQGVQHELNFLKRALLSADEEKAGAVSAAGAPPAARAAPSPLALERSWGPAQPCTRAPGCEADRGRGSGLVQRQGLVQRPPLLAPWSPPAAGRALGQPGRLRLAPSSCTSCPRQSRPLSSALLARPARRAARPPPAPPPVESAVGQLERIRQTLEDLLLLPPEVEEAALKCCWLAHYWVRASSSSC